MTKRIDDASIQTASKSVSLNRSNQIYRSIFNAIVDHKLQPGTHLREDELCDLYGVGRTRIRMALSRLASDHVVELQPNRGAFVASPSVEEAREVFRARRLIEGHLIRRVADLHDSTIRSELSEHLNSEAEARVAGDAARVIHRCGRYHQVLADQAESPIMARFLRELVARSSLSIAIYGSERPNECEMDEHQLLSKLVIASKAEEAAKLMDRHLQGIEDRLDLVPKTEFASALQRVLTAGASD